MHQKTTHYYLLILFTLSFCTHAANNCPESLAKVISFQGKVDIQKPDEFNWRPLEMSYTFCFGDKIRTSKDSRATLKFKNDTRVTLDQNSTLIFAEDEEKDSSWINDLIKGRVFIRSRETQETNVHTPFINAVHEGTEYLVTVTSSQAIISVFDGRVSASNTIGKILIEKGFIGIAGKDQAPHVQAITMQPEDAVQWSLYYPPIIDYGKVDRSGGASLQASINANLQDNPYKALTLMNAIPASQQDADYLTLKSSLLLMFGSVEEAINLIDQALALRADNSTVIALQSIIEVTKNRQDKALSLAQKASKHDPQSAVAQIALSYAYQSKFDLDSAIKATKKAIRLSPDNALAWARLSELQLSTGERRDALESAQKAQILNPKLGRTQTILGFASLALVDIDEAKSAFTEAIKLDSADPLAHLGLGLAKIRKGDIEAGTSDIETAVSLDPDNSIMRSYLGKAYYELKNDGYAETELAIAKEADPKDPTPWFYDAIRKQTTNRPVEALHDMQKAIGLNDNRGIYRSKLLLDEDLAARSASLGRIYNDLGFQQLGLIEGWKSVNNDHGNYSAHQLLADNYSILPKHEIARVSELLQSQLLQPINITPVQPQSAESNLKIFDSIGPNNLSLNEYNPLFSKDRPVLQASGLVGSNKSWGDEVIISGLWNKFSYSLGQFHFETDGFRENDHVKQDLYNAFVQIDISPSFSFQIEGRKKKTSYGDIAIRINETQRGNFSDDFEEETIRAGLHFSPSVNHDLITSLVYKNANNTVKELNQLAPGVFRDSFRKTKSDGYQVESQYLFKSDRINLIFGGGYSYQPFNQKTEIDTIFAGNIVDNTLTDRSNSIKHYNIYTYVPIILSSYAKLTLGISFDSLNQAGNDTTQINPKFGLEISPTNWTTFRYASFRTLKRPSLNNQTIEPTQVSGFNQFFDDFNATRTWRHGIAVDQRISKNSYGGIEFTKRILTHDNNLDSDEYFHRAYLYWAPFDFLSLSAEYTYKSMNRDYIQSNGNKFDAQKINSQTVPLTLGYYSNLGLFFNITSSYVKQSVNFVNNTIGTDNFNSNFWNTDISVGYRFPKRYGLLSINLNNVFNRKFKYQSPDFGTGEPQESPFKPDRMVSVNLNLSL